MWRCAIVLVGLNFWQPRSESSSVEAAHPNSTDWTTRFSRLPADEAARLRRKLLEGLPKRLVTAARLVLEEDAYQEWKRRYAEPILSLARGERLPATALYELWNEADRLERLAIQRLSRAYRMQVYQTYRDQRTQFEGRQNACEVEAAWMAAGGWPDEQPRLIEWLKSAIWASRPGTLAALPPTPAFQLSIPSKSPNLQITKSSKPAATPPSLVPRTTTPWRQSPPSPIATVSPRVSPPFIPRETPRPDTGQISGPQSIGSPLAPSATGNTARRVVSRPAPPVEPGRAVRPESGVRVNIDEISVRVAGFNLALAALEQQFNQNALFSAKRLAPLVEQLGELTTRHGDMRPYYQYLSAGEARRLGELRSCVPAIRLAAARIVASQRALHEALPAERDEIDRISRRLAEIAAAYHAAEHDPRPHAPRGDATRDAPRQDN